MEKDFQKHSSFNIQAEKKEQAKGLHKKGLGRDGKRKTKKHGKRNMKGIQCSRLPNKKMFQAGEKG